MVYMILFLFRVIFLLRSDPAYVDSGGERNIQDTVQTLADSVTLRVITLEEAYALYQSNKGIFVDSRSLFFYNRAHIRGAISICYRCTDTSTVMREMPRDQLLIVYCSGPRCDQAQMLIQKLRMNQFRNIYWFKGGMDEWREAGYPIDEIEIHH